jgi:antitoxin VapB
LDGLLLQRASSFAWATAGAASYVNTASSQGEATLLVTPNARYLVTNNIEATRLEHEEKLAEQGWTIRVGPWHEPQRALADLTQGLRLGADGPFPGATNLTAEVARLRSRLLPAEGQRMRELGLICAQAMDAAIRAVQPGQTEFEIAGLLAHETQRRGAQAIVNLIATDERIYRFRHPLPTGKVLDRYAMLVLCGRRQGLVCSITRLVHFGPLPADLRRKAEAVAQVDAAFMVATRPGRPLAQVFQEGVAAYEQAGYDGEWRLHHQGGPAGYEAREWLVMPGTGGEVLAGQAYAWNPSITGVKSEDTLLVGDQGNEMVSEIAGWPAVTVEVAGQPVTRPAILEIT